VLVGAVSRPLDLHLSGVELDARTARLLLRLPLRSLTLDGTLSEEARRTLDRAPFAVDGRQRVRAPAGASDVEPPRPPDLALTRLELIDGGSQWFWSIGLDGAVHHVHHGRAGTRGTWSWKRFPTDDVAEELLERRIEEKLREGFTPVEARPQRTLAEA
jgi:predicted DNA-binding WGR domain protein